MEGFWEQASVQSPILMKPLAGLLSSAMGVVSASLLASASLVNFASVEIPLSHLFNNQAASIDGSGADFDRLGSSFDAQLLPKGQLTYAGIKYTLPASWGQGPDNILATGQVINLPNAIPIHELHFIYAGDGDSTSLKQRFNFTFADNSTESVQLVGKNWWTWPYQQRHEYYRDIPMVHLYLIQERFDLHHTS
ncbi:hypothetical protein PLICRDRAFT_214050 [Plicaturopsis crispa FD-325 SS-3]|nr:hypothetical protein PLICRDRAFT_214050 [Plicaturopsis crispa FD-325 SS-3]